jgi:hypothetical protein
MLLYFRTKILFFLSKWKQLYLPDGFIGKVALFILSLELLLNKFFDFENWCEFEIIDEALVLWWNVSVSFEDDFKLPSLVFSLRKFLAVRAAAPWWWWWEWWIIVWFKRADVPPDTIESFKSGNDESGFNNFPLRVKFVICCLSPTRGNEPFKTVWTENFYKNKLFFFFWNFWLNERKKNLNFSQRFWCNT